MSKAISNTGNVPQNGTGANVAGTKASKGGLEGVVAATTAISKVDGLAGHLIYRGYDIHELARTTTFEEVIHLLWFGHLPNQQ
ncbi:MAG TPA: citrate/2-methylcitrate synthase, partial [Ktedonobacteraceae bacterium]|nr:citrate/2-methylcitrate synthase [Ktedonobacteraceae bacterium]